MDNKFNKLLVFSLIIMMFLVSCTQGGNDNTMDVVNLVDDSFLVIKDSEFFKTGNLVVLNNESENINIGEVYRVRIDEKITKSIPPITNAIEIENIGTHTSTKISFEDAQNLKNFLPERTYLIDVRTKEEFSNGHLPGALNVPSENFERDFIDSYDRDDIIIVYCQSGNRSGKVASTLVENGYNLVFDAGGINSYSGELE